jgi:hypothetical protein
LAKFVLRALALILLALFVQLRNSARRLHLGEADTKLGLAFGAGGSPGRRRLDWGPAFKWPIRHIYLGLAAIY